MKNYKRIKRFGAAATAIAMLGTLSVGVFADEADVVEETVPEVVAEEVTDETVLPEVVKEVIEAPVAVEDEAEALEVDSVTGDVKDSDNLLGDTQLDITAVTATKQLIAETTDQYNYTVTLSYAFDSEKVSDVTGKQVAMVGYTYNKGGDKAEAASKEFAAAEVFAIDQAGASATGTFVVKLTSKSDAPKKVENDATLILKIGSDALANGGAQAVAIDLAGAKVQNAFTATKAVANPAEVSVPYGSTEAEAIAALSGVTATVSNDDNSNSATGYTVSDWAIKSGTKFDGAIGAENIFVGKVVRDEEDSITFANDLTVEVKVTISALTDGDITVNVKKITEGTVISQPADCIESISIKGKGDNSGIADTIKISSTASCEWVGEALTKDSKAGTTAQIKIVIPKDVESDKGLFKLALSNDVEKTVTITVEAAGMLGDVNGDDKVNGRDAIAIQKYVLYGTVPEKLEFGDVNGDSKVNGRDAIAIQKYVLYGTPFK